MTHRNHKSGLEPVKVPTDFEIAWAAGVYEGEGSCVQNGRGKISFSIVVSQKDPELLYRLKDLFGGSVARYNVGNDNRFEIYHWVICGDYGRMFIAAVYPYLTARRKGQIDSTSAKVFLDFLGWELPRLPLSEEPSTVFQNIQIANGTWVAEQKKRSAESRKKYLANHHQGKKVSDAEYVAKRKTARNKYKQSQSEKKRKIKLDAAEKRKTFSRLAIIPKQA